MSTKPWGYSSAGRASEWHAGGAERCGHSLPGHDRVERNGPSYRLWRRDDNGIAVAGRRNPRHAGHRAARSRSLLTARGRRSRVSVDRLQQAILVAMAVAEFALDAKPSCALSRARQSRPRRRLAGASDPGQRPVRKDRVRLTKRALELCERAIPSPQKRRRDAIARSEWVRQRFGSVDRSDIGHRQSSNTTVGSQPGPLRSPRRRSGTRIRLLRTSLLVNGQCVRRRWHRAGRSPRSTEEVG